MASRSRARASTRLTAGISAIALIAASFATLAHQVEKRHEVCTEHGELIHVGEEPRSATPANSLTTTERDADHGEHCSVAWAVQLLDSPEPDGARSLPALDRPAAPASRLAVATSRLYRLAPKNSPPV